MLTSKHIAAKHCVDMIIEYLKTGGNMKSREEWEFDLIHNLIQGNTISQTVVYAHKNEDYAVSIDINHRRLPKE